MTKTSPAVEDIVHAVESRTGELLFLLLAFDGVLVDYADDPDSVQLPADRRELLRTFAARSDVALGIVSGRRVTDLVPRTGLHGIAFHIGLHGFEAEGPGFALDRAAALESYTARMQPLASTIEASVSVVGGVRVEDKGPAIALHTRQAGSVDAVWARLRLLNSAAECLNRDEFRVLRGNHVLELVPNVWHPKIRAITAIHEFLERQHHRGVFTLYVGEDVADDEAFGAIEHRGLGAVVGKRATRARYRLATPLHVALLVDLLLQSPDRHAQCGVV
jgi:trehalose-phosphatase